MVVARKRLNDSRRQKNHAIEYTMRIFVTFFGVHFCIEISASIFGGFTMNLYAMNVLVSLFSGACLQPNQSDLMYALFAYEPLIFLHTLSLAYQPFDLFA